MSKRTLTIIVAVVLVLAVGGFIAVRQLGTANATAANLQTAEIQRGTLTAAVNAAGTIAAPQSATLVWKTNGVVGTVNVSVGNTVNAGDALMELDPSSLDYSVIQAQADLIAAQQTLDTLLAGPTEQQLAQAKLSVVQADQAVTTAERNLKYVMDPVGQTLLDAVSNAQLALDTAKGNSELARVGSEASAVKTTQDDMNLAYSRLQRAQTAMDDCTKISCGERVRVENELNNSQNAYQTAWDAYQTALLKYNLTVTNQADDVKTAQENYDKAKANLAAAQAGPDPAKVTLYQAQLDLAKANLKQVQDDLSKLQSRPAEADVAAAQAKVAAAQAIVDSTKLVAPFRGTVVAIENRVGDSVTNNQTAVTIADLSSLEIQVDVSEVDINRISIGQDVNLTADAVPGLTFQGKVSEISILGRAQQGVVTYPVTVVVPDPDPALKPGMTAAVGIVTDQHANVLLVPNRAIRVNGGQRTVTVLFEGEQIAVPVTLGLSNDTFSEIVDGQVKEGDTVVINASAASTASNRGFGGFLFGGFGGGGNRPGP